MSKLIPAVWSSHLQTEAEREAFDNLVTNSTLLCDRLYDIVDGLKHTLERQSVSTEAYNSPSWSHLQAHYNGNIEALTKVLKLLEFVKP